MKQRYRFLVGGFIALIAGIVTWQGIFAQGTKWEYVYGSQSGREESGFPGMAVLSGACGGGYAVTSGTTYSGDVYVVRTGTNGSTATPNWEYTYDINNGGGDGGSAIRETGNGLIVVGTTDIAVSGGPGYIFLMKLGCDGSPWWTRAYGDGTAEFVGRDVIVAANGDLVACGWMRNRTTGARVGFMMRTDSGGILKWQQTYDAIRPPGFSNDDVLYGLTETTPYVVNGVLQTVGDIAAAGYTAVPGALRDGWALRVDGATGTIITPTQGAAHYGGVGQEDFNSVRELQVLPETGNLIFSGHMQPGGFPADDIYLIKTAAAPWTRLVRKQIGDLGGPNMEVGLNFIELQSTTPFAPAGDLALTGVLENWVDPVTGFRAQDAFLLRVTLPNLLPLAVGIGGGGFIYGDHGQFHDGGVGIGFDANPATQGFVISGYCKSNLGGGTPFDLDDIYLIKTDPAGHTGCELTWNPPQTTATDTVVVDNLIMTQPVTVSNYIAVRTARNWGVKVCGGSKDVPVKQAEGAAIADETDDMQTFPNPVTEGDQLTLQYTAVGNGSVLLRVVDASGREINATTIASRGGEMKIPLSTRGWGAGAYIITLTEGGVSRNVKVMVSK